jgi:methyl-accepting chemotaxis protein
LNCFKKIENGNNEMMDSQSQLKENIFYIQANQEEQKEALNNLGIIMNVTSHNILQLEKEILETKENVINVGKRIETTTSRIATQGLLLKVVSKGVENINTDIKKTNEEMQKIKKQNDSNQIILADNNQKFDLTII